MSRSDNITRYILYLYIMEKTSQEFNGLRYTIYYGYKYFTRGYKKMHIEVWRHYKGAVPNGYTISHIDGNVFNNAIENLKRIKSTKRKRKVKKRLKHVSMNDSPDFWDKGVEAARNWHSTDEGVEWHKENGVKSYEKRKANLHFCQECDTAYKTKHAGINKFCSAKCKARSNRRTRKEKEQYTFSLN